MDKPEKLRVLIAAHAGKPWGGMAACYEALLASSLPTRIALTFVETQDGRASVAEGGHISLTNLLMSARHILRFTRSLLISRPEVVDVATAYGLSFAKHSVMVLIARLFGKKVILSPHCSVSKLFPVERRFWCRYVSFILRQCRGLLIISKEWLSLETKFANLSIRNIPNALDLKTYLELPRPNSDTDDTAGPHVRLLYLGYLGVEKGSFDLIKAANSMRDSGITSFVLDLIGGDSSHGEFAKVAKEISDCSLGATVRLWPAEFGVKKLQRLGLADVYVLPSYHEGMPVSVIEAMAAGLPVVATNVGGIPDLVVSGETGLLVPPGEPLLLADALRRMILNPGLRLSMGLAGRRRSREHFDIERKVEELVRYYHAVAGSSGSHTAVAYHA